MDKKKPERTCMACNNKKEKQDLLRIVKSKEGIIEVDITGKKNGKGAYICKTEECLNKLVKAKRLEKVFKKEINNELYENITSILNSLPE